MDSTVIATSLPAIAADIGTSPIALKLALTAYLVSLAVFIPVSGWMADRFGAKNVFRAAIMGFVRRIHRLRGIEFAPRLLLSRFLQGDGGDNDDRWAVSFWCVSTPRNELVGGNGMGDDAGADRPAYWARRSEVSSRPISAGTGFS